MDDQSRNLSSCGTQIDDLPSCLIMDILLRLPTTSLLSWYLFFSDPLFLKLHHARSPTYQVSLSFPLPDSGFTSFNSCNGLVCLENYKSRGEIYVCNPALGECITIPVSSAETICRDKSFLGFSSRSNQFKILHIKSSSYQAGISTIGDSTRRWKSIGIAPCCPQFDPQCSVNGSLNGSIHWLDGATNQIVYFNFDSEQFGSLPSPPEWRRSNGSWSLNGCLSFPKVTLDVLDGCLSFHDGWLPCGPILMEVWVMKEYGVEESWTKIFRLLDHHHDATYNPSFFSLQDVAKGEQFNVFKKNNKELLAKTIRSFGIKRRPKQSCYAPIYIGKHDS